MSDIEKSYYESHYRLGYEVGYQQGSADTIKECNYNTELFRELFLENLLIDCYDIEERENIIAICKESWIKYQQQLKEQNK